MDERIFVEAAIEWLRDAYQLSRGEAEKEFGDAIRSDNVRRFATLGNLPEGQMPPGSGSLFEAIVLRNVRVSFDDLRRQIALQIRKPNKVKSDKSNKPDQMAVNLLVLKFAEKLGSKIYRSDVELCVICKEAGASRRQVDSAYKGLPDHLRYRQGEH